jgi:hypothetical protein
LLRQPLLRGFRFAPLLRTLHFTPVVLVLCFELLDASTTVDIVEAKFEDAAVVDSAFTDVLSTATRASQVLVVV